MYPLVCIPAKDFSPLGKVAVKWKTLHDLTQHMSPSKPKPALPEATQALPVSFEAAVAELEALVHAMDSQSVGLDQLLTDYKRGAFLVKYCRDRLSHVRKEVAEIELALNQPAAEGDQ